MAIYYEEFSHMTILDSACDANASRTNLYYKMHFKCDAVAPFYTKEIHLY